MPNKITFYITGLLEAVPTRNQELMQLMLSMIRAGLIGCGFLHLLDLVQICFLIHTHQDSELFFSIPLPAQSKLVSLVDHFLTTYSKEQLS